MRARESSTSYNTKENTVIARKPTRMDQRAQEGKQALQLYLQTSPNEGHYQRKHPLLQILVEKKILFQFL